MGKFEVTTTKEVKVGFNKVSMKFQFITQGNSEFEAKDSLLKFIVNMRSVCEKMNSSIYSYSDEVYQFVRSYKKEVLVGSKTVYNGHLSLTIHLSKSEDSCFNVKDKSMLFNIINKGIDLGASVETSVFCTNIQEHQDNFKVDLCKQCKNEAEKIVSGLGSVIEGIDSIVYNSSGNLLRNTSSSSLNASISSASLDALDMSCVEEDLDYDTETLDGIPVKEKYAEGIVDNILKSHITVQDSITVVWLVK